MICVSQGDGLVDDLVRGLQLRGGLRAVLCVRYDFHASHNFRHQGCSPSNSTLNVLFF